MNSIAEQFEVKTRLKRGRLRLLLINLLLVCSPFLTLPLKADEQQLIQLSTQLHLAYVQTGHASSDRIAAAGLRGLVIVLHQRTSVQNVAVIGVNVETDPLALFPLLYWVVTPETADSLTATAQTRLYDYLRHGGMVVFDTRQARDQRLSFVRSPLQRLAGWIPPLTTVSTEHVLARSFYLLEHFLGRYQAEEVWVEATPSHNQDQVSSVVIGTNDWIGAWAVDRQQRPLLPVLGGEQQREMAYRFGVNLVMYALTGNYKTDQIHQAAILARQDG